MKLFPFFENIEGKIFLIIGGGKVARGKAVRLSHFGADILVLAPETEIEGTYLETQTYPGDSGSGAEWSKDDCRRIRELVRRTEGICILKKEFEEKDLLLADYVIAATNDREKNAAAAGACRRQGILVNVVDDPQLCTFIFPSLIKRGSLTVGITTGGSSPTASRLLREQIEELLPQETEEILARMELLRNRWKTCPSAKAKKNANRRALIRLLETGNQAADEELEEIMAQEREKNWVIATRGSALALTQAEIVRVLLKEKGIESEIHIVTTGGDRDRMHPLSEIGGKGVFVKEIEKELLSQRADIAVHSGKDLPYELARGTVVAGIPKAADGRDCLITRKGTVLSGKLRIGTGSPRRILQLKRLLPEAVAAPVRGNIDTRLGKLREGSYDGILLAKAGLDRLQPDLADLDVRIFSQEEMLPAACQGILAVQCRKEDSARRQILKEISDPDTFRRFMAERYMLRLLKAECTDPVGVCADIKGEQIRIRTLYGNRQEERLGALSDYQKLCEEIAKETGKRKDGE